MVFVLMAGVCINAGVYYQFTQNSRYPLINYVKSIVALKGTFYSWEVMFTSLLLNLQLNNTKLDLLEGAIQNFTYSSNYLSNF